MTTAKVPGQLRVDPRVGRLLTASERVIRMAAETVPAIPDEVRRTAFAISGSHLLTAWHCVRGIQDTPLWFRIRTRSVTQSRQYAYIPVKPINVHELLDVAVLAVDGGRLDDVTLTEGEASAALMSVSIALGTQVGVYDLVRVVGFPLTAPSCDCDINACSVVAVAAPLGEATCLKLYGPSFAAVDPVDPHGLSGGPVLSLQAAPDGERAREAAVGIVRAVPTGWDPNSHTAVGGGLLATHMLEAASVLTEVGDALARSSNAGIPKIVHEGFAVIENLQVQGMLLDNEEFRSLRKEVVLEHIRREQGNL